MTPRPATIEHAPALLRFFRAMESDRTGTGLAPDEEIQSEAEALEQITWFESGPNRRLTLMLTEKGAVAGYASAIGGFFSSDAHAAQISIEVLPAFRRQGVGRQLLLDLLDWGAAAGMIRFELGVLPDNEGALRLYESLGFEREGVRRAARQWQGDFHDEILMALLLGPEPAP
jgi:RimJ/RimL family protein N-acetyltransferase